MDSYFNMRVDNQDFLLRATDEDVKNEWVKVIKENIVMDDSQVSLNKHKLLLGTVNPPNVV